MTTPNPTPPEPQPPQPGPPQPPQPPQPPAPEPSPAPTAADMARLEAALADARKQREDVQKELDKLRGQSMTEQEKAVAAAREEGKAEAERAAALKLVAAEFRIAAAGKLANPDAALAALDLAKLLDPKSGEPDAKAIAALVDQLAVVPPPPGQIPAGPRVPVPAADGDFIRQIRGPRH
jgi:hypothetical protein